MELTIPQFCDVLKGMLSRKSVKRWAWHIKRGMTEVYFRNLDIYGTKPNDDFTLQIVINQGADGEADLLDAFRSDTQRCLLRAVEILQRISSQRIVSRESREQINKFLEDHVTTTVTDPTAA